MNFFQWTDTEYINYFRTSLLLRSSWPTYNEINSVLVCFYLFSFWCCFVYLLAFIFIVFIFIEKDLKVVWIRSREDLEGLRGGEKYD